MHLRAKNMKLFFKPKEAAERLSVSTRTLANKRALGNGPPFLKMDGVVRYPIDGLERFINKNLHHNARANNNAGGRVSNYKKDQRKP